VPSEKSTAGVGRGGPKNSRRKGKGGEGGSKGDGWLGDRKSENSGKFSQKYTVKKKGNGRGGRPGKKRRSKFLQHH